MKEGDETTSQLIPDHDQILDSPLLPGVYVQETEVVRTTSHFHSLYHVNVISLYLYPGRVNLVSNNLYV